MKGRNIQTPSSKLQRRFNHQATKGLALWKCVSLVMAGGLPLVCRAQQDTNEIPQLRPIHAELPPTYWEQHGTIILALAGVIVLALGVLIWLMTRPSSPILIPPEVLARTALQALPANLAEGVRLSRVSQILRDYLRAAFGLPAGELTTTEFCQALKSHTEIESSVATELAEFFRDSDRRKFSLETGDTLSFDAITAALSLIEKCEVRRAVMRATQTKPANSRTQTA